MDVLICPKCGRNDLLQKVSAVVASGTASLASTDLAARLARPAPPTEPVPEQSGSGWIAVAWLSGIFAVSSFGLFIFAASHTPADQVTASGVAPFALCIGIPTAITIAALSLAAKKRTRVAGVNDEAVGRWKTEREAWMKKCAIWDTLYVCLRDDLVFPEGDRQRAVASSNLRQLL